MASTVLPDDEGFEHIQRCGCLVLKAGRRVCACAGLGSHFDMSYCCSKHIPMVQRPLGSTLKTVAIEEGPGSPPTYLALGHLYFESVDAFVQAWGPIPADEPAQSSEPKSFEPWRQ